MRRESRRNDEVRERLAELPPSSKFVYTVLEYNGSLSQKEIVRETMLAPRTARYALKQLEEAGLVRSRPALHDARQTCYAPSGTDDDGANYATDALVDVEWVADNVEAFRDDEAAVRLVQIPTGSDDDERIPGSLRLREVVPSDRRGVVDGGRLAGVLGEHGVGSETSIVLYSADNNRMAAYAYWTLTYYGHREVYLLNGGFDAWKSEGRPVVRTGPSLSSREYEVGGTLDQVRAHRDDVVRALTQDTTILDVRSPSEHEGEAEPSEVDQPEGHIPGAVNVPWLEVFGEDGRFQPRSELARLFEDHGVDPDTPVIVYCSVGERSALVWFVLRELLGYAEVSNYDGSWIEWGNLVDVPIERKP